MKNGLTMSEAFGTSPGEPVDDVWADALAITFGELSGATWDWRAMAWKKAEQ